MKHKILLIGGGGHCKVVIDAIRRSREYGVYGIVDPKIKDKNISGVPVVGTDKELARIFRKGIIYAFIAVGSIGDCSIRERIYKRLRKIGFKLAVIKHPASIIAFDADIGDGTFIAAGSVINPGTKIGRNVIINTSSSVDHDCRIGDFVHIAPGVVLSGGVKVGRGTHIGTGANIIQYITIGKGCMIGAGLTLRKSLPDGKKYILRPLRKSGLIPSKAIGGLSAASRDLIR